MQNPMMEELSRFYQGMFILDPVGNNAFSYENRRQKRIYVASLIEGDLTYLLEGEEIVFSEVSVGQEINKKGLKNFVYWPKGQKDIFIFDNHSHAFFFWVYGVKVGKISKGSVLIHVDEHSDLREPERYFDLGAEDAIDLRAAFDYANYEINVGNFIKPALQANIFSHVAVVNSQEAFEQKYAQGIVLDIDMDIFSKEMDYIPERNKIEKIRELIGLSSFITVATSPYFMEQDRAIQLIHEIFE